MASAVNIFCDHLGNIGNHLRQQNCIRVHGGDVHGTLNAFWDWIHFYSVPKLPEDCVFSLGILGTFDPSQEAWPDTGHRP